MVFLAGAPSLVPVGAVFKKVGAPLPSQTAGARLPSQYGAALAGVALSPIAPAKAADRVIAPDLASHLPRR